MSKAPQDKTSNSTDPHQFKSPERGKSDHQRDPNPIAARQNWTPTTTTTIATKPWSWLVVVVSARPRFLTLLYFCWLTASVLPWEKHQYSTPPQPHHTEGEILHPTTVPRRVPPLGEDGGTACHYMPLYVRARRFYGPLLMLFGFKCFFGLRVGAAKSIFRWFLAHTGGTIPFALVLRATASSSRPRPYHHHHSLARIGAVKMVLVSW